MKINKASNFLKHAISSMIVNPIAKAKSMVFKGKTSASKARLIIFTLMKNKKASVRSRKRFMDDNKEITDHQDDQSKAIVPLQYNDDVDEDKYPDLTRYLFNVKELELEMEAESGSIIEMVKNSKEESEDFSLEDEIDHVADLFITRFYKQMRLPKAIVVQETSTRNDGDKPLDSFLAAF